jgi:arginyl-tRNA synthetase
MMSSLSLVQVLTQAVSEAICRAATAEKLGSLTGERVSEIKIVLEIPKDTRHGDYATPVALGMKKLCDGLPPAKIAQILVAELHLPDVEASIAGPGYINFRLRPPLLQQGLNNLLTLGHDYGKTSTESPERILVEFVSANPTGPLHVGHGRWAAVGSTLANLLAWSGHQVEREFYINDAGNQMQILGQSLQVRVQQLQGEAVELPEDAYRGSYLVDIAKRLLEKVKQGSTILPSTLQEFTDYAYQELLAWQQATLHQFGTDFDHWFSERRLHTLDPQTHLSAIEISLQELEENDYLYRARSPRQEDPTPEAEEAVYFKTAEYGDDKDRVVRKGDGSLTYLAADIAYHRDKVRRGYNRLINILGSDHHGYVARLQAGVAAFSSAVTLECIIGQFVKLFQTDPQSQERTEVRMSKRTGNFVSLNDLIEDEEIGVGVDAARWFLLSNSMDSPINFDLDVARQASLDNPVVYAHYSHARCCTLLRRIAEDRDIDVDPPHPILNKAGNLLFIEPEERLLLMRLLTFPDEVKQTAVERAPHKLIRYVESVASDFNKFYDRCRIYPLLDEQPDLAFARLQLVKATRQILYNTLTGLLGISAPESM